MTIPWQPWVAPSYDLVVPSRVDPAGVHGPTKRQAAGPRWRQTSSGMYVPSDTDSGQVEQRILEQAHRLRSWGAVTGWAALRWRGAAYFDGRGPAGELLPVPLVVGRQLLRADPRIRISQTQLAPHERMEVRGIPVVTTQRALFDVVRLEPSLRQAVVAVDMAAAAKLISVRLVREYILGRFAWTGVPHVRRALDLASDDSKSPQESRMRLVWVLDAGLPAPLSNPPVFSESGELLGYPDLFDPETGTAGEYDGAHHRGDRQRRDDLDREARFRDHGIEVFTVVEGDLRERQRVVRRMLAARARARRLSRHRRWTLTPPRGWTPREEPLDVHLVRTGEADELVRWWRPEEGSRYDLPPDDAYPHTDGPWIG